jgi:hypothetical protein
MTGSLAMMAVTAKDLDYSYFFVGVNSERRKGGDA